jgi:hypothetical protein
LTYGTGEEHAGSEVARNHGNPGETGRMSIGDEVDEEKIVVAGVSGGVGSMTSPVVGLTRLPIEG